MAVKGLTMAATIFQALLLWVGVFCSVTFCQEWSSYRDDPTFSAKTAAETETKTLDTVYNYTWSVPVCFSESMYIIPQTRRKSLKIKLRHNFGDPFDS